MTDLLAVIGEALEAYWSSPGVLFALLVVGTAMASLVLLFLAKAQKARLRVGLLTGLYVLAIFFWLFVAASLVLCVSMAGTVAYRRNGVALAGGSAVLAALAVTAPLSWFVWRRSGPSVIRRFVPRSPRRDEAWIQGFVDGLAAGGGGAKATVGIVDRPEPLAIAVGGPAPHVLVSRGLLDTLDREEVETVTAHEFMHLRHHDAEFKVVSTILSRLLFFDPFSKLFDPAVHREREYLADEMSGRSTGKPAALASALLKISEGAAPPEAAWGLSIHGPPGGVFSRYPPLRERVERLLRLSQSLAAEGRRADLAVVTPDT